VLADQRIPGVLISTQARRDQPAPNRTVGVCRVARAVLPPIRRAVIGCRPDDVAASERALLRVS
jgi:hypothetical protein